MSATACYVCGGEPHAPEALHVYTTDAEARAWFAAQPDGSEPEADETLRFPGED